MVSSEISSSDLSEYTLFQILKIFRVIFFQNISKCLLLFVNSNDFLEKSHQILSDYSQFLLKKNILISKTQIISSEKMRNSGYCIYDYDYF